MEKTEYIKRVEDLGYKSSDELVKAVQTLHGLQLTDGLIDQAYADFRRAKNPPLVKAAKAKTANTGTPPPAKTSEEGGK